MNGDRARGYSVTGAEAVVVGAGRSGVAAAGLLARRGARVTLSERLADTPEAATELLAAGVTLELGGHRPETFAAADLIVLSPGVSPRLPEVAAARARGIPVMSELELAARWLRGRIVAVTGTKGKSTTVVLTGRMLDADGRRAVVGGNIGVALSSQVEASTPDAVHVVEASSFQLELTDTFRPWIAVCLNLSPDHLDRHASFAEYAEAKGRIFANQTSDDAMVINADDPAVLELARKGQARALRFAIDAPLADGVQVTDEWITRRSVAGEERLIPRTAIRVPGRHLLSDVAAAAAVGSAAGVAAEAMTRAVESFTGLPHTLEFVREVNGVRYVNDSKATNLVAARAAIECFGPGLTVILGGRFKGGRFEDLRSALVDRGATVVVIGEARDRIRAALDPDVTVREADTMAEAVGAASAETRPGGTVLLAPACASLDMFVNYAARGAAFREAVQALE
ncbi:MAG: UDP-N-acetylmuramoyl-L-alanine--D-glutamate ligase [Acidobacteria bacterium]|nr:UDP-N-acetylmuramoyl-L-alanine--D-glutamate ligase [Acidobacteriota bacterium]MXZ73187.1 UDP-N-acetylmuramoyl-L-alanine--D-glutamate ligase [Acidobacteriota bacterium]MYD70122.1 UDP-N-acetylmuramoyl-L-alanine--D-glutamate ligase [Acidobacteriota bacterium]